MHKKVNNISRKLWLMLIPLFSAKVLWANDEVAMADVMRSNGKIYMVVAVCLTILIGLILYLISIDRKISKIEKDQ